MSAERETNLERARTEVEGAVVAGVLSLLLRRSPDHRASLPAVEKRELLAAVQVALGSYAHEVRCAALLDARDAVEGLE